MEWVAPQTLLVLPLGREVDGGQFEREIERKLARAGGVRGTSRHRRYRASLFRPGSRPARWVAESSTLPLAFRGLSLRTERPDLHFGLSTMSAVATPPDGTSTSTDPGAKASD